MNNTCPFRHLNVPAQDLLNMTIVEVCKLPMKVNDELEHFGR